MVFKVRNSPLLHYQTTTNSNKVHQDPSPTAEERERDLEDENAALRRKVLALERELQSRSPTKKTRTKTKPFNSSALSLENSDVENTVFQLNGMSLDEKPVAKTPKPRQRKLTTRKWDLGLEGSST